MDTSDNGSCLNHEIEESNIPLRNTNLHRKRCVQEDIDQSLNECFDLGFKQSFTNDQINEILQQAGIDEKIEQILAFDNKTFCSYLIKFSDEKSTLIKKLRERGKSWMK